jgi:hypothetical protein
MVETFELYANFASFFAMTERVTVRITFRYLGAITKLRFFRMNMSGWNMGAPSSEVSLPTG